jgi:Type II CAAX prenyl endopeptidase Rce1-like
MRPGVNHVMLQRRAAVELLVLATSTAMFLLLLPNRPLWMNMGLALLALALVGISAGETRGRFWGSPAGDWRSRQRRSAELVLGLTLPVVVAFGTFAAAGVEPRSVDAIVARLFGARFFVTFAVFVPWALGQQTLFQFYLLGRLRALLPRASPLVPVVLTGLGYGAVHLPDWEVALLAGAAGILWSFAYRRDRVLLPIACSHAILGATYFSWVRGGGLSLALLPAP